jgi:hypothetical protein
MRTLRLVSALLPPTLRAVNWWPLIVATGLGYALVELALSRRVSLEAAVNVLRAAALLAALAVAFLLDDPAEPSTEAVAGSRLLRRTVRIALALPLLAAWWGLVAWRASESIPGLRESIAGLTLEAAATAVGSLALAAAATAWAPERLGGVVAGPGILVGLVLLSRLPDRVAVLVMPGPAWGAAHQRWAVILGVTVLGFLAASAEPAGRGRPLVERLGV